MRPSDLARFATAAAAGVIAPYIWVELVGLWALHVYIPLTKLVWTVFALRGPLVFWIDTALEAIVFGVLFGVGLWALGSAKLPRLAAVFSIAFLATFFGFELATSNALGDEKLALVSIAAPSVVLLLAVTAGTCWVLPRRKEMVGA